MAAHNTIEQHSVVAEAASPSGAPATSIAKNGRYSQNRVASSLGEIASEASDSIANGKAESFEKVSHELGPSRKPPNFSRQDIRSSDISAGPSIPHIEENSGALCATLSKEARATTPKTAMKRKALVRNAAQAPDSASCIPKPNVESPSETPDMDILELDDKIFDDITNELRAAGQEDWSQRPRTYKVLSMMSQTVLMDEFVKADLWDIALPYRRNLLPTSLTTDQKDTFLAKQHAVLSKEAKNIEGGPKTPHANFGTSADAYLELIENLGSGAHGVVDRVRSKLSKKVYARKTLLLADICIEGATTLKNFNTEILLLKKLNHRHLVRYVGSYTDPERVGFLMTPVGECDLQNFLGRSSFAIDDLKCIREAFGCLCAALIYLQEQRCRHKDIKPANILIKGGKVFITDFGIANDWSDKTRSTTQGVILEFSLPYAAPEVLKFEARNTASDMWSLGCVFLDMLTVLNGESLEAKKVFFENSGNGTSNPTNQEAYKEWMKQLKSSTDTKPLEWIRGLLRPDPKARVSAHVLMQQILECDDQVQYYGNCCDPDSTQCPEDYTDGSSLEEESDIGK